MLLPVAADAEAALGPSAKCSQPSPVELVVRDQELIGVGTLENPGNELAVIFRHIESAGDDAPLDFTGWQLDGSPEAASNPGPVLLEVLNQLTVDRSDELLVLGGGRSGRGVDEGVERGLGHLGVVVDLLNAFSKPHALLEHGVENLPEVCCPR